MGHLARMQTLPTVVNGKSAVNPNKTYGIIIYHLHTPLMNRFHPVNGKKSRLLYFYSRGVPETGGNLCSQPFDRLIGRPQPGTNKLKNVGFRLV